MMRTEWKLALLDMGISAVCLPSLAADVPSAIQQVAGKAERTAETNRQLSGYYRYSRYRDLKPSENPVSVSEGEKEKPSGEISFMVKEVRVTASKFLTEEDIRGAVRFPGPGEMKLSDLKAMVDRLNGLYKEKKILTAEAVLPPQTVKDGIVYIRLIEGKYGETSVSGNHRISTDSILHRIHTEKGQLSDLRRLEDEVRVYNATNTYQLTARLVPGKEEGASDVELFLHEAENPISSFIFTDNTGQKESGRYRIGAYTEYRGIGGHDASLAVAPIWTEGIWGGSVIYDTPMGHHGTRMALSYSRNLVDIIDGAFKDFDLKSNSNDMALSFTHPLNVTVLSKVDLFVEGHRKWSDTSYAGMELSDNETRTVKAGLSFRSFDENGLWFGMASVTGFKGKYHVSDERNDGSYYNMYLMRRQDLPGERYLTFRAYGQYSAFKELPSTEQFTLGGMSTVRGYRESLLSGDKGWYGGLEYGFPLSSDKKSWRSFVFLDHGVAYNNYGTHAVRHFITSTGLGLEYSKGGWYGRVVYGIPLNHSDDIHGEHGRIHFYLQRNV